MRIVLLGATGFVGKHLLPELSAAGHHCIVLCRYKPASKELALIPGVELRQVDVYQDCVLSEQLEAADAVINLVGILNESGRDGSGFHRAHVELVAKIIEACHQVGVRRLLHLSALHAGNGQSHYLRSKGEAEELVLQAKELDSTLFQPSVIFGSGDSFFNRFAGLLKLLPVMPLACPKARMQPVWVGDVVKAMTIALEKKETYGQTLVLVGPRDYSLKELVEFTAGVTGLKRRIAGLPDPMARLQGHLMDFVPGKPFSSDNYRSLQTDNTSTENAFWSLGIRPHSIDGIVESYLGVSAHQRHLDRNRAQAGR